MTTELMHLVGFSLAVAVMWVPYVTDRTLVLGVMGAMENPREDAPPLHPWAQRNKAAHTNALESYPVYAALILALAVLDHTSALTVGASWVFLAARATHYAVYTAGIPVVRTLAFVGGWGAIVALGLAALMGW